jgi:hypothetical protein
MLLVSCAVGVRAQGNYEVQVYGSALVPVGATMVESHTNFTAKGAGAVPGGTLATHHALHETLEVTHGFNEWFETGFYLFSSVQPDGSWKFVGTHIRPRIAIPERYNLPVGLSLSTEIGYQQASFDPNTWSWEIRPIVDKQIGRWYAAFNPTFEKTFHGPAKGAGYEFSPNVKLSYDLLKRIALGIEYYGGYASFRQWQPFSESEQMILPVIDVDFGPRWEFNFGVGMGVTHNTDRLLIKGILGYRFGGKV